MEQIMLWVTKLLSNDFETESIYTNFISDDLEIVCEYNISNTNSNKLSVDLIDYSHTYNLEYKPDSFIIRKELANQVICEITNSYIYGLNNIKEYINLKNKII